jgi:hypothetical protein
VTVTATKTRKRWAAATGRRRSGGGGLGFGFEVPGRRISGGDPAVAARGCRGGDLEEEPRRRSGGVRPTVRSCWRQRISGGGCELGYIDAHSRWLPFIGDEIRDC